MVKYSDAHLDNTFSALGNPTRRAILDRLNHEPGLSISALAKPLALKLPAIMKHLDVLAAAGLVSRSKCGRTVSIELVPKPMNEAMRWLKRQESFWSSGLDRLTAYAEDKEAEARKNKR